MGGPQSTARHGTARHTTAGGAAARRSCITKGLAPCSSNAWKIQCIGGAWRRIHGNSRSSRGRTARRHMTRRSDSGGALRAAELGLSHKSMKFKSDLLVGYIRGLITPEVGRFWAQPCRAPWPKGRGGYAGYAPGRLIFRPVFFGRPRGGGSRPRSADFSPFFGRPWGGGSPEVD